MCVTFDARCLSPLFQEMITVARSSDRAVQLSESTMGFVIELLSSVVGLSISLCMH